MKKYLGRWVECPACGSSEATMTQWNDGEDVDFQCPDCGEMTKLR